MDLTRVSEHVLVARALARDGDAWRELLRRYGRLILACIARTGKRYRITLSEADVEDVYAEVCLRLLANDMRRLRVWDPRRAKLSTWIGMMAVQATADQLRAVAHRPADRLGVAHLDERADQRPGPAETLLARERWDQLEVRLESLSPRDRRFFVLHFALGLDPESVAKTLGISVKTVYTRKHRIRRLLLPAGRSLVA
jgi:RNA polymerase sigma-70 factor, ECF subfamily